MPPDNEAQTELTEQATSDEATLGPRTAAGTRAMAAAIRTVQEANEAHASALADVERTQRAAQRTAQRLREASDALHALTSRVALPRLTPTSPYTDARSMSRDRGAAFTGWLAEQLPGTQVTIEDLCRRFGYTEGGARTRLFHGTSHLLVLRRINARTAEYVGPQPFLQHKLRHAERVAWMRAREVCGLE